MVIALVMLIDAFYARIGIILVVRRPLVHRAVRAWGLTGICLQQSSEANFNVSLGMLIIYSTLWIMQYRCNHSSFFVEVLNQVNGSQTIE